MYVGNLLIGEDVTFVNKLAIAKTFANDLSANEFVESKGLTDVEVKKVSVTVMIEEV
ncbi:MULTISPECIES: hypothetical protein [Symbiopectobacterium]|uniref:hypothetical protein n=1 Tax=Symbiopectobacterium TaxID=801 RepID=UPI002079C5C5|nr:MULTISPECIES: hypothetical protein [Symbiopectobacterium]MBT9429093.1 hypothetical protein [Candidatus Symbiopectobacterium endolongispinus]